LTIVLFGKFYAVLIHLIILCDYLFVFLSYCPCCLENYTPAFCLSFQNVAWLLSFEFILTACCRVKYFSIWLRCIFKDWWV